VLFAAGLLFPFAAAFSDSHPIVAWSSLSSHTLSQVNRDIPAFASGNSVVNNLLDIDELCSHDLVVVISKQGLHANHLRDTQSNKRLASLLEQSSSSFQLPHITSLSQQTFEDMASRISSHCGHKVLKDTIQGKPPALKKGSKHVICMEGNQRHPNSMLMDRLDSLTSLTSNHLVIIAGIPSKHHQKRQTFSLQAPNSSSASQGGIFKRFQLFTRTLLTAFLIFVLIWIPIVVVGLKALTSIQVPRIGSIGKASVSAEKKNQ